MCLGKLLTSHRLEWDKHDEELRFNYKVNRWKLDGTCGENIASHGPHRADGDFQVAEGEIELDYSWKDDETSFIPDKVVDLIEQIVPASKMLVYGCKGKYHSLKGMLNVHEATVYLKCTEFFWRQFPISHLLTHCLDPTQCELEFKQLVKVQMIVGNLRI